MSLNQRSFEVVVVGAGPAGLSAASAAAECGKRVAIVDDNPGAGGQIWRDGSKRARAASTKTFKRFAQLDIERLYGARVIAGDIARRCIVVETESTSHELGFDSLVIATG